MQNPNFLQRLLLPFYKADYYRHVVETGKGLGLKRVLAVLALNWLVTLAILAMQGWQAYPDFQKNYQHILSQWPTLTIAQGQASIAEPLPYVISLPNSQEPMIVFATSEIPNLSTVLSSAPFVVLQKQIIVRKDNNQSRMYSFSEMSDTVVDRAQLDEFLKPVMLLVVIFSAALVVLASFIFRIFQVLFYGILAGVFNTMFRTTLSYPQLCRVAALALTPVLVLDAWLFFIWNGPKLWFFNFFLAMIFMGYGVSAQKKTDQSWVNPS